MTSLLHPLHTDIELPQQLNNPFCYEPHPLCVEAARRVCAWLDHSPLKEEVALGKMLGVLVCLSPEGQLGFLAAYSGQLGGRADWPWFVPAVFDYLQPDGYFKREEAAISAINRQIDTMEHAPETMALQERLKRLQEEAEQETEAYRQLMAEKKQQRDALRRQQHQPTASALDDDGRGGHHDEAALIRESQFQKAELRRMKQRWAARIAEAEEQLRPLSCAVADLKEERRRRSDALQRWLFDQFVMLNDRGERRALTSIFADTPQQVPPSGAGECCAPKLLQYAFLHLLKPLAIAEFWQGQSPRMEIRHHGQYYPACRGKCKPILEWMIKDLNPDPCPRARGAKSLTPDLSPSERGVISLGGEALVISKPAGLLSVPGRTGEESVESLLQREYKEVYIVHRLDQDTSGLMVVALTKRAYHNLQQQFLARTIYKKYIALIAAPSPKANTISPDSLTTGTIRLPLRPDPLDRPRQVVDFEHGKEAITHYEVLDMSQMSAVFRQVPLPHGYRYTLIALTPHTGRTHQLRVHCAHPLGLGCPIVGDRLYGYQPPFCDVPHQRLCLHAAELSFLHPVTGERVTFHSEE